MKKKLGFQSALLVSGWVIGGAFALSILAWFAGLSAVGVLLMSAAVTGLISRLWAAASLRGVRAVVRCESETLSAGQTVTLHYSVENAKAVPLVWLELCQDVPVRGCLEPDSSFVRQTYTEAEAQYLGRTEAYVRRFSFIGGGSTLEWDCVWTGVRRGVYRPQELTLRSGDGFGLTQTTGQAPGLSGRVLTVWPKLVPVETWPFLRHVWSGTTGKAGWQEDPTVMLGERAYLPGDPWKHIDWRTAARTDELMVRQFDRVMPLSVLFIFDAVSLDDVEEGLSLLASLIFALDFAGIDCGVALPATAQAPCIVLRPEDPFITRNRCLFALADFEAESAKPSFDFKAVMSAAAGTGQVWMIAGSAAKMSKPELAGALSEAGVRLLSEKREKGVAMTKEYTFDEIRKKEASV